MKEYATNIEQKRLEIISYIKKYIRRHHLQKNDPLPSENELAEQFQVNRNTVRSSLAVLKAQGFIYSQKGRGFFVAERPRPFIFQHDNALGFSEILNKGHRNYESRIVRITSGTASPLEQKRLAINENDTVYRLKHVRSMNGRPFSLCLSVLPQKRVPDFDQHLETFFSVNNILINDYGFSHPICQRIELAASLPKTEDIELLNIPENMPILMQESVFHVDGVGNVEYFIVRARGDMFRFSMSFR